MKIEYALPCRGIEQLADTTWMVVGLESNLFRSSEFLEVAITFVLHPQAPPGWDLRVLTPVGLRFQVEEPGAHSIEFTLGDSTLGVPVLAQQVV